MSRLEIDRLVAHLGKKLVHVTAATNLPLIRREGLLPAASLARRAGLDIHEIALRRDRLTLQTDFGSCTLNHQRPILHGTVKTSQSLEDYSAQEWAQQLDDRVFFWPQKHGESFAASIANDVPTQAIYIDTRRFLERYLGQIDLCPINSGNFRQGGANTLRGVWIYVPARRGLDAFRNNRTNRGLVKNADNVKEISLRGAISAAELATLCEH